VNRKILVGCWVVLVALPMMVQAAITDAFDTSGLINKIKFTNYEAFVQQDGQSWTLVDPEDVGSDVNATYQLVSIFSATELTIQNPAVPGVFGPEPAWQKGNDGYFLGYSVVNVSVSATGLTYSNPTFDPFNKLDLGTESLWLGTSDSDWVVTGDMATDVASVLGATQWATFGIASSQSGFYTLPPVFGTLIGVSAFGLNQVDAPANWPGFDQSKAHGNDMFGGANIYRPGEGDWSARSEDPLTFAAVPEPATLAMWGSCLMIGALVALRRRQK